MIHNSGIAANCLQRYFFNHRRTFMQSNTMHGTPFRRANIMFAAIAAIMDKHATDMKMQQQLLARMDPYQGRGKGGKHQLIGGRSTNGAGMANHRTAMKRRNVMRHRAACK